MAHILKRCRPAGARSRWYLKQAWQAPRTPNFHACLPLLGALLATTLGLSRCVLVSVRQTSQDCASSAINFRHRLELHLKAVGTNSSAWIDFCNHYIMSTRSPIVVGQCMNAQCLDLLVVLNYDPFIFSTPTVLIVTYLASLRNCTSLCKWHQSKAATCSLLLA